MAVLVVVFVPLRELPTDGGVLGSRELGCGRVEGKKEGARRERGKWEMEESSRGGTPPHPLAAGERGGGRHGREAAVVDTATSGSDATVLNRDDATLPITPWKFLKNFNLVQQQVLAI